MNGMVQTKKNFIIIVAVCAVLAVSLVLELQMNRVTEAAVMDPHPGLVGWWSFDEGTGSVAGDSSGNGNDGTIYGIPTWMAGKYEQALSFDGQDDYVNVYRNNLKGMTELTISLWVYRNAWGNYRGLVAENYGGLSLRHWVFRDDVSGNVVFWVTDGVNSDYIQQSGFATSAWEHIVAVFKGGTYLKLYRNGLEVKSAATAITQINSAPGFDVWIGRYASYYLNGIVDEVRIYNRALSAAEIQESFQKKPDFSSKLLAKIPKGTTQVIATVSWQGIGNINVTMESPSKSFTEDVVPVYQKTVYSTSGGTSSMLNIKRLSMSVVALSTDENWYVMLEFDGVEDYRITVEVQK
jgi:hypothetical protein